MKIGRKSQIIGAGVALIAIILSSVYLNFIKYRELSNNGRYTVGTTLYFTLSKDGRDVTYEFFVDGKRYESFKRYGYSAKVPGGRYLVEFSSKDPSICDIYLNRIIPDGIIPPLDGWKKPYHSK